MEFQTDYHPERGTVFKGVVVRGPAAGLPLALDLCKASMIPAPKAAIEEWLAEVSVLTIPRQDDEMSAVLRLRAYTKQLSAYPADAVKAALLGRPWKFFPAWAELHEVLEVMIKPRRAAIARLEGAIRHGGSAEPERGAPASKEAVARIMAEVYGKKAVANG